MGVNKKIGELLIEEGIIREEVVMRALQDQKQIRIRFGALLVKNHLVSENDIAKALSRQYGLEYVDIHTLSIMPDALLSIPEEMARRHLMLPVRIEDKALSVVTSDPLNVEVVKEIEFYSGKRVHTMLGTQGAILEAIQYHYRFHESLEQTAEISLSMKNVQNIDKKEIAAPVIKLVNLLLSEAVENRASDIHIEPSGDFVTVRFRIDGVLVERTRLHPWVHGPLTSRFKILARLNIAERRLPQDGGFRVGLGGKDIDLRVSIMPVSTGEKTVIRILDQSQTSVSLEDLGLSEKDYIRMKALIQRKKGIILVTGPTGSGKTTTLYSIINRIKSGMTNIVTVEDPIEYNITGINQVQVKSDIGLTFARCLRSILRQDPDVILVGEIRDEETAEIAFRAAMTGHLVLSTLHTNDAASTITRLVDIGIPRYVIASTVIGIVAQRLVRRLCPVCKVSGDNSAYVPAGCHRCSRTGYYGRAGVFEIFTITPGIREIIVSGGPEEAVKRAAASQGIGGLFDDAFDKVRQGITTPEEVYRAVEAAIKEL